MMAPRLFFSFSFLKALSSYSNYILLFQLVCRQSSDRQVLSHLPAFVSDVANSSNEAITSLACSAAVNC